ncbi:MAG TPA: protein translocase subunit SecD [Acidimicrobiales bacterium]|nr:protein translocase subunit SecD [Acidimicrobiales bacterium]
MRRSLTVSLILIIVLAFGSLGAVLSTNTKPALGLDLQGGISVVLEPGEKVESSKIDQAMEIIRSRVDALGVAEPDINRQGDAIVVQLPGVKNQDDALKIVGQTAELRFRPVLGTLPAEGEKPPTTTTTTSTTVAPGGTTTTTAGTSSTTEAATTTTTAPDPAAKVPTTKREDDKPDAVVVLPAKKEKGQKAIRYQLGPAELVGSDLKSAQAAAPTSAGSEWQVSAKFKDVKKLNEMATRNYQKPVAIVLDGVVQSAPVIQAQTFERGEVSITGSFTKGRAKELALVLRYGSLPVSLKQQTVQKVSPSLGRDSLKAGLISGFVGLALVLLYIILYYRALGLVVVLGLCVSGALLWSIVSMLSRTSGLALSLAGATGIIVSVGVTVDSYVVYFERLKDEIRSGKTIRSSVDRGFTRAFRTILAADISSLIGAGLLYFLTVGAVRGFAFFLGLSTLLDIFVAYFFTRPMVVMLGRSRLFTEARWVGVARGLAASEGGVA